MAIAYFVPMVTLTLDIMVVFSTMQISKMFLLVSPSHTQDDEDELERPLSAGSHHSQQSPLREVQGPAGAAQAGDSGAQVPGHLHARVPAQRQEWR